MTDTQARRRKCRTQMPHKLYDLKFVRFQMTRCCCRSRKSGKSGGGDEEDGKKKSRRHRSEKKERSRGKHAKKANKMGNSDLTVDTEGLTSKQRRKVVSKAIISSSEGSDSDGENKLKIDEGLVSYLFVVAELRSLDTVTVGNVSSNVLAFVISYEVCLRGIFAHISAFTIIAYEMWRISKQDLVSVYDCKR